MTVAALTPTVSYAENGVTLGFAVPFRFNDPSHLVVKRIGADGVVTVLAYGAAWSATGGATDAGGTVTLVASVAGSTLTIVRATPRSQATDYDTNDRFPAESHEAALDRAMLIDQEQDVATSAAAARSLRVPDGEVVPELAGAADRAGKALAFDLAGNPVATTVVVPASVAQPERMVLTLEQFGGAAGYVNAGSRGKDNTAALSQALDVINRYAPVNARWPRVPRIMLGMGGYFFGEHIDLKVAAHLQGQASGDDDFNGGTRFMFPPSVAGITINNSDTRAGTTEGFTTAALGTVLEGIQFESEGGGTAWDSSTTDGNLAANTFGIWGRATFQMERVSVKGFAGNGVQIVAFSGGGGALQGNASGFRAEKVMVRDVGGIGWLARGNDANTGVIDQLQIRKAGLIGIWDRDTLGNTYIGPRVDDYATVTAGFTKMAACNHLGINYMLVDATPGVGQATTPGTNAAIWYPLYAAGPSDFFMTWLNSRDYVCMLPILVTGQSNKTLIDNPYIEGGNPGHAGGTTGDPLTAAIVNGGQSQWTRTTRRLDGSPATGKAVATAGGWISRIPSLPGTSEAADFGLYTEAGLGEAAGQFLRMRVEKTGEVDYVERLTAAGDIELERGGSAIRRVTTHLSTRTFGGALPVPYVGSYPKFALCDPTDSANDRLVGMALAPPTIGYHQKGKRLYNADPGPLRAEYWVCVTSGTPGSWVAVNVAPLLSGAATALTGTIALTDLLALTIPAGIMGPKGVIDIDAVFSGSGVAGIKTANVVFGAGAAVFWSTAFGATITQARSSVRISNRNNASAQVGGMTTGAGVGSNTAGVPMTTAIDTTVDQVLKITGQLASAADTLTLESYAVRITPGV